MGFKDPDCCPRFLFSSAFDMRKNLNTILKPDEDERMKIKIFHEENVKTAYFFCYIHLNNLKNFSFLIKIFSNLGQRIIVSVKNPMIFLLILMKIDASECLYICIVFVSFLVY